MPHQSLSVRPKCLQLSGEEHIQNEFIKALGPYFARAKFDNREQDFLAHTFNIWFVRWPLKLRDFKDADFMQRRRQSIEKVRIFLCTLTPSLALLSFYS